MKGRYTEEDVIGALEAVSTGTSVRQASREYGVLRVTLQDSKRYDISSEASSYSRETLNRLDSGSREPRAEPYSLANQGVCSAPVSLAETQKMKIDDLDSRKA
jgi:hypothetical protein